MKLITPFCISILLLLISNVTAQEFKLGKVSVAELQEKVHPKDTAAAAAILYKKGSSRIEYNQNDGFVTVTDVETRIKSTKKKVIAGLLIKFGIIILLIYLRKFLLVMRLLII